MTVATPADIPVKIPGPDVMVPTVSGLLLQAPPDGVQFNVVVAPVHTLVLPVIGPAAGDTVTASVTEQPPGSSV